MSSCFVVLYGFLLHLSSMGGAEAAPMKQVPSNIPPALGCWFMREDDFVDHRCREYIDMVAKHAGFSILTTSLRIPRGELTDQSIYEIIREAAEYAAAHGIGIAMDLDVRLARSVFAETYPDELQEMLRLRETARQEHGDTRLEITPETPSDHYTGYAKPYVSVASRLVRVYAFSRTPQGIDPDSVADITYACRLEESNDKRIRVLVPESATRQPVICACVAFAHFTPDVFAPHLLAYQRELLHRYADVKLAGACKDEWGFPPCFDGTPDHNDFWYSEAMAAAYFKRTGRDLVRDCLLMYAGEAGREAERQGAINHFMEMNRQRNAEIEGDFYDAVKEIFGPDALVATHPTWWPQCDRREFKKNGLHWWAARRDYAQTDECTPFSVRTALAKKWNNSVWYNMFYAPEKQEYETGIWGHALAGGRVNFHPLYPLKPAPGSSRPRSNMTDLFTGGMMRGEARIRLLNFINPAPLDCRIAIVFGHPCAMNWAGPAYEDVGMALADGLWREGYHADLIPTSEIEAGALKADAEKVAYGTQDYDWVVLYHPEFERPSIARFFHKAAEGRTGLIRVGDWTRDFDGKPFEGNAALPTTMKAYADGAACLSALLAEVSENVEPGTPAVNAVFWNTEVVQPPATGQCRLVDGTHIVIAGQNDPAGDPIQTTLNIDGYQVVFDAIGVAAVRLTDDGAVQAMAAGGLKHFRTDSMSLDLPERCDVAIWRDGQGEYHGVIQGCEGPIPGPLTAITNDWIRLRLPVQLSE